MDRTSVNTKEIQADLEAVWKAFTEKKALEYWLAPYGMTGKIHDFDLNVGGGYEMSLYYNDKQTKGKTSGNEDRFIATFTDIKPFERLVQTIHFQSTQSELKEEMTMDVQLDTLDPNATKVTIIFRNIPMGIDPKDNEDGTEQSLQKLAAYLESQ